MNNHSESFNRDGTSFELQAIDVFEFLSQRFQSTMTAATTYAYLKELDISDETIFDTILKTGISCGFLMRKMIFRKSDLADKIVEKFLVKVGKKILWVESLTKKEVLSYSFNPTLQSKLKPEDIFFDNESITIILCEGLTRSFMTSDSQGAEVKKDHSKMQNQHSGEHHDHHEHDLTALILNRLTRMWNEERQDILVVVAYSIVIGLMSLVVPLSASAIVNAITLGVFTTQLFVMCFVIAIGLLLVGVFEVMQRYVVDILQRRIFVRTTFEIAHRLPNIKHTALLGEYTPEVMNRFFDILTIQKSLGKFFLDGLSSILVTAIGLILLAVYHPFFLLFNVSLFIFIPLLVFLLGRGGLTTSIAESKKKYAIASWLEEIARCQKSFKLYSTPEFVYERIDSYAIDYIRSRHDHFKVLMRQIAGSVVFRAFATVGILGIGGSLVIERQLTIGELVAAELVLVSMLSAIEKLIEQFESHYDLFTAIDKVSHITDKPIEPVGGEFGPSFDKPIDVKMESVTLLASSGKAILKNIDLHIPSAKNISLVGQSGSGKSALVSLLVGMQDASSGSIEFNDYDISRMDRRRVRSVTGIVMEDNQIFDGTVEENILLGRNVKYNDLEWAIELSQLKDEIKLLPKGLKSHLLPNGLNVSVSFGRRLMFARAIVARPRLLVLDESFAGVEERIKLEIIDGIFSEVGWTVINISHDAELLQRSDTIYFLEKGEIVEECEPQNLCNLNNSKITRLFPELTRIIGEKSVVKSQAH